METGQLTVERCFLADFPSLRACHACASAEGPTCRSAPARVVNDFNPTLLFPPHESPLLPPSSCWTRSLPLYYYYLTPPTTRCLSLHIIVFSYKGMCTQTCPPRTSTHMQQAARSLSQPWGKPPLACPLPFPMVSQAGPLQPILSEANEVVQMDATFCFWPTPWWPPTPK